MATVIAPDEELITPDQDVFFEVIDGRRVELPPMSAFAQLIASQLVRRAGAFADAHGLGEVVGEVLFALPAPVNRNRRPDVAFVSYQRFPQGGIIPPRENAWDVVPDLAVEVVSPTDFAGDLMEKVHEYFRAGVR